MHHPSLRAHTRTAVVLFAGLGAQVGAFAVLVPDLAASRGLTPAALGAALAVASAAAIATLFVAGPLTDRHGRRPLLVVGATGFAAAFALLATVEDTAALWPTLALYGVASGCLDLGANAVGADYERVHGVRAMVRLHAGFSATAAVFAFATTMVSEAAGHQAAYAAVAGVYVLLAAAVVGARLPPHAEETPAESSPTRGRFALLGVPAIALAAVICTLCFFGDGTIEGFSALLLRGAQDAGTVGAGLSLAAFHAASLVGRLVSARVGDARGDAFVLTSAGLLAAVGMTVLDTAGSPILAGAALLVVGFALAPVIPTVISLAGRSAPGHEGAAVSLVTTLGYSSFVLGPPVVGAIAGATTLRTALALVIGTTAAVAVLGGRVGTKVPAAQ